MPRLVLALLLVIGCHPAPRPAPTHGGIGGLARDQATGEPVVATVTAHDEDSFAVATTRVAADGSYQIDGLLPGSYGIVVELTGTSLQFTGVPVTAGHVTGFDIPIDLGGVGAGPSRFADAEGDALRVYQPTDLDPARGRVEGTVTDTVTRERVAGAVITATAPELPDLLTEVSDDHGRFRFVDLPPGTYSLSAYYNVPRRGEIEVRRAGIVVEGGHAVIVPIFVEVTGSQ